MALANEDLQAIAHLLDMKIGSALQPITVEIREVKEDLKEMKEEVREVKENLEGVKEKIGVLRDDLEGVKGDIQNINLYMENVIDKNINLLVENYVPAAKRYESAAEEISAIQSEQYIMKKVITKHSEMFQRISLAAT